MNRISYYKYNRIENNESFRATIVKVLNADLSLKLLLVGITFLFLHEVLLSLATIYMTICYTGFLFLFLSFVLALSEGKSNYLERKYAYWLLVMVAFGLFMLFHGIVLGHEFRYISRDIWPFCFFACILVAAKRDNWAIIDRLICFQFGFSVILVFFIWYSAYGLNVSRDIIIDKTHSWETFRLAWAWGLLHNWPYMIMTYRDGGLLRRTITVFGTGAFFVLALMYQKRMPFALLILFVALYAYCFRNVHLVSYYRKKRIGYKFASVILVLIALGTGVYTISQAQEKTGHTYVTRLFERVQEGGGFFNMLIANPRFDRIPKAIIGNAVDYELVMGQGLGSTIFFNNQYVESVESGLMELFFKGGIIYVVLWYYALIQILFDLLRRKKQGVIKFQILASLAIIMAPVSPIFNMNFLIGYNMLWFGRSMAKM